MLYLLMLDKPKNYNNEHLVGYDLIKKIDFILNKSLDYTSYNNSFNSSFEDIYNSDLSIVYVD